MSTLNYLAYGSNLFPPRLADRITIEGVAGVVAMPDTQLVFHKRGADGSGKCTLLPVAGAMAYGVVYRIDTAARSTLDRIEGVGHGYEVESWQDARLGECYFYRAEAAAIDAALIPLDWYHAYVLRGAQYHGMPANYIESIASVTTMTDSDADRRAENYARLARQP